MPTYRFKNMAIATKKNGATQLTKSSFVKPFGQYSEIRTSEFEFQFNLLGEIKSIRGLNTNWPHPADILRRTDGNDWVYHTVGSVVGCNKIKDYIGEYYLPCLTYPSNAIWEFNPYSNPNVAQALGAWSQLYADFYDIQNSGAPSQILEFINLLQSQHENSLHERSKKLSSIIGGSISVLPPDSRHVNYEVIPLIVADGCLYNCDFCQVKSHQHFQTRSKDNILSQMEQLKDFYGQNIRNYMALFLGNHDALGAGEELILMAAEEAYRNSDYNGLWGPDFYDPS